MTLSVASVTVNITAGALTDLNETPLDTAYFQLIATTDPDGVFSLPTTSGFAGAGEMILGGQRVASVADGGIFQLTFNFELGSGIQAGQSFLLRWWPDLTDSETFPYAGANYGQFTVSGSGEGSVAAWEIPSDGSVIDLEFLTESIGGSQPNAAGQASFAVIPEPSTYALGVLGALGAAVALRRRRNRSLNLLADK